MKKLIINPSEGSPKVILDLETQNFLFAGVSMPEDVKGFYEPILQWVEDNVPNFSDTFEIIFDFNYFNTPSQKYLYKILKIFETMHRSGRDISVRWCYDDLDPDMLDLGVTMEEMIDLKFNYFAK